MPIFFCGVQLGDLLDVGRAGRRHDGLAFKIVERFEVSRLFRHEAIGGHEVGDRERDLFLPLEVVGGRAALKVDRAVCHQRNAGGRGDGLQLDLEFAELEVRLHRVDDLVAEVHRIADDLLLVVIVGERKRRFAMADRDRAGILDFFERTLLRGGGAGEQADGRNSHDHRLQTHRNPRKSLHINGPGAAMVPVAGPYHRPWPKSQ